MYMALKLEKAYINRYIKIGEIYMKNYDKLLKQTIKSFCKKWNITIKNQSLTKDDMTIYENSITENTIFNDRTLTFLNGFNCAMEIKQ